MTIASDGLVHITEQGFNDIVAETEWLHREVERAYQVLELLGVPRDRARSVDNGIMVLDQRYQREIAALQHSQSEAEAKS